MVVRTKRANTKTNRVAKLGVSKRIRKGVKKVAPKTKKVVKRVVKAKKVVRKPKAPKRVVRKAVKKEVVATP